MFKKLVFYYRSDLDPDPIFHERDPRIRIRIKMKRIRNTGINYRVTNTQS